MVNCDKEAVEKGYEQSIFRFPYELFRERDQERKLKIRLNNTNLCVVNFNLLARALNHILTYKIAVRCLCVNKKRHGL